MSRKIIALLLSALVLCALCAFASIADGTNAAADSAEVKTVGAESGSAEDGAEVKTVGAAATAVESRDQPIGLVIGMGIGVVFFGLICIVILSMIMSAIVRAVEKKLPENGSAQNAPSAPGTDMPRWNQRRAVSELRTQASRALPLYQAMPS